MANDNVFTLRLPDELQIAVDKALANGRNKAELGVTALAKELGLVDRQGRVTVAPRGRGQPAAKPARVLKRPSRQEEELK